MDLSNCITDDITICINDNMGMQSAYLCFVMIHENANYVD